MNRKYSLKKNKEFNRVYRGGKSAGSKAAVLLYRKSKPGRLRIGFTVSKKIGGAVTRNLVKRRMREATRLRLNSIERGWDLIFIARAGIDKLSYAEIDSSLGKLLSRAGLTINDSASKAVSGADKSI